MEGVIVALVAIGVFILVDLVFVSVLKKRSKEPWREMGYDLSLPVLGEKGWYMVFEDDFEGEGLNEGIHFGENYTGSREIWCFSPHCIRYESDNRREPEKACYWCDEMVEIRDSRLIIHAQQGAPGNCSCTSGQGRFCGGIETRRVKGEPVNNKGTHDELLFAQAFGYFECRAKVPRAAGMWSAFWLQSSYQRRLGNGGMDGTEIDIFESAFFSGDQSKTGHALLWDGYGKNGFVKGHIAKTKSNLYEGFHTYALKWTPSCYVFYVDGEPTWACSFGGVSRVKEFLRLTTEIDTGDGRGPHGQKIGQFGTDEGANRDFEVDYVKVWQCSDYEKHEMADSEFKGEMNMK